MPRGDKSKYTDKQERKADHIVESYEDRSVPEKEANGPGQRSTRTMAEARNPAARGAVNRPTIPPLTRAAR